MQSFYRQDNFLVTQQKFLDQMNGIEKAPKINFNHFGKRFVKNLENDEIRTNIIITSSQKRAWNVQIELINEFARVCKKYNLRWFAFFGTLLGAARHKGFIPWDDDVDLVMFRPDYNKFLEIAPKEIKYPYFFDNWYNYTIESDQIPADKERPKFQYISFDQQIRKIKATKSHLIRLWPSFRLSDSRTTMIGYLDYIPTIHQGIFIDVFALDSLPSNKKQLLDFELAKQFFLMAAVYNSNVKHFLNQFPKLMSDDEVEKFLHQSFRVRGAFSDKFAGDIFFDSDKIGAIRSFCGLGDDPYIFDARDFDKTVYLPFEEIELPVPVGWENILNINYGDWHKMIFTHVHSHTKSADIPFTEYYRMRKINDKKG